MIGTQKTGWDESSYTLKDSFGSTLPTDRRTEDAWRFLSSLFIYRVAKRASLV